MSPNDALVSLSQQLGKPFYQVFTLPPKQLHPIFIHFPIVFLEAEALFLLLFLIRKKLDYEHWALNFLRLSFWSMLIAVAFGLYDCGLNMGSGNRFLLGLQDRMENAFRFESSVTVHFWLAILLLVLTSARLICREQKKKIFEGKSVYLFWGLTLINLWCLLAMSYVGGLISHQ